MNGLERLRELATGAPAEDEFMQIAGDRELLQAVVDLIESIEIDNTAGNTGDDDDPSRIVLGNVKLTTLALLGFSDDLDLG